MIHKSPLVPLFQRGEHPFALPLILALLLSLSPGLQAQQRGIPNAADLEIALQKLNVLGSVLYVGAHPDDENTALLAAFSKGRKYRTAYLSVTRGEGGQNLIGPEQGAEIGLLRTQELLSARRVDGAEQYFTRAVDFGYSKTAQESLDIWGKESVLGDLVWVIRRFRPDVIITRFAAEGSGGHGHHTAQGMLIKEAFSAAADPARYPEQLAYAPAWKATRILLNRGRQRPDEAAPPLRVETGAYNPLLGKSYSEIAGESRSQHKSQGFGSGGRRGAQYDYFELWEGAPAAQDIFEGIDATWSRVPGGQKVGALLAECIQSFDPRQPARSIPGLLAVQAELAKLPDSDWARLKKEELARVIQGCAGLWLEAIADDFAAAPGDEILVRTTMVNRSDQPFVLHALSIPRILPDSVLDRPLKNNEPVTIDNKVILPKDYPISQPYWLEPSPQNAPFSAGDRRLMGQAENPPSLAVAAALTIDGARLELSIPVLFRWTDQVQGELYRPFEVRPRVTLRVEDGVKIFPGDSPQQVKIRLKSHSKNVAGTVRLKGSDGWRITPAAGVPFSLAAKSEEADVAFEISPPKNARETVLTAEADLGAGETCSRALVEVAYPHIHRQVYFPPSRIKLVKLDVQNRAKKVGYIMGAGDDVADALGHLGVDVTMLTDEMLETSDLSSFDAIVAGVRAYNTRERLKNAKPRLLEYVERGGTLVIQYNVASAALADRIGGPYPLTVGRDRVTVETAPVTFPLPDHPLLTFPNKITAADFEGWIQERGLYFASTWDPKYEAVLASHDPGEQDLKGGLLYARHGKGVFIYTAYAWFRQLPAGVPGAFRIFANLISAGKR
jgi:LmbE family N-acetylglucosaminyl deacetylase